MSSTGEYSMFEHLRERDNERVAGHIPVRQGIVYVRALPDGRVELGLAINTLQSMFIELSRTEVEAVARRLGQAAGAVWPLEQEYGGVPHPPAPGAPAA